MIESDNTDLPHPDSPTIPRVRPRPIERSTPSTAATSPAPVWNTVRSAEIDRRWEVLGDAPSPAKGGGAWLRVTSLNIGSVNLGRSLQDLTKFLAREVGRVAEVQDHLFAARDQFDRGRQFPDGFGGHHHRSV
jgi:hypothetical protein